MGIGLATTDREIEKLMEASRQAKARESWTSANEDGADDIIIESFA